MTLVDPVVVQTAAADDSTLLGAVFVFVVSFLVGTFGIRTGARLVVDADTGYGRAAVTALFGSVVWTLFAFFLGWIPILGPAFTLLVWIGVINRSYRGGWGTAAAIGFTAWLVAAVVLSLLAAFDVISVSAVGIPGL